jgi:hypothetical protein
MSDIPAVTVTTATANTLGITKTLQANPQNKRSAGSMVDLYMDSTLNLGQIDVKW